ncbi:uncharacterized protein [Rhodnius prolixus]|uniref:uncharacterized protein n=1 Tax=Rhodnius prolixus TaxID=13249 RepID=UPI003D18C5CC
MLIRFVFTFSCLFGILKTQKIRNIDYSQCGKRYTSDVPTELGSYTSESGKFPWHVGIYKFDKYVNNYENICGGTLISAHIVLSAASCFYDAFNRSVIIPTYFKVTAGKIAYSWMKPDNNAQERNVNDIAIPETYVGDTNSYSENIAVINLAQDVSFNDLVLPICIDWTNKGHSVPGQIVQTAGWGLKGNIQTSPTLKEAYLQYINIVECRKKYSSIRYLRFINYDKICVLTPDGRREQDTGGGLVYKKNERYYLLGVLSAHINNDFSPTTNVSKHLRWIREATNNFNQKKRCLNDFRCLDGTCISERLVCDGRRDCADGTDEAIETCPSLVKGQVFVNGSCLLPAQRGGVTYTKKNCGSDCEVKSGVYVYPNEIVRMNCGQGFAPNDTLSADATFVCTSGTWFPQIPECLKLCSALKKENLRFECTYKKQEVDCDGYMRPGTIAKYRCVSHYTFADPLAFTGSTICQIGGRWKDHLPTCIPQCGVENQVHTGQPTISFGAKTVYGKYPWHIGLFSNMSIFNPCNQNNPNNCRNNFINMCGGTLIHKNFVLSAAHCLFHPSTGKRFREIDFRVAGGKFKRNFNIRETYQQISGVRLFITPETYAGTQTRYEHDIALIYTEVSFVFNDFVLPACLDTSILFIPTHSALGTIVGWGLTEDQTYSEDLKEVHLPVMPTVACRNKYKKFIQFITTDKFCVIYRDGAGAQEGDSGGGITFIYGGRHYVIGIVSVKKRDSNVISAFTNVSVHMEWLQTSIKSTISQQRQRFNGELVYRHSRASREQMMVPDSVNSVKDHFQQYIRVDGCKTCCRRVAMLIRFVFTFSCLIGILKTQKIRNIDYAQCGKRYTPDVPTDLGSYTSESGKFPWHVSIYKFDKYVNNYENICGGTLISAHIVLSAASCFYDAFNRSVIVPTYFKVAAGKIAYSWMKPDNNAQERNVNDIAIPETYVGETNSYSENIAVINLAQDVSFNDLVLPICIDWTNKEQIVPGQIVQTAGWGLKGNIQTSPTLKEAHLQYINVGECRKKYSSEKYLRFINYDKVCVLTPNGRREQDTGGGLVYKKNERYYLLGVLSAYINNDFSPTTNVSKHLKWIREATNNFNQRKRCLNDFRCLDGRCISERLVCDGRRDCADGTDEAIETCPSLVKDQVFFNGSCPLPSQLGGVTYTKKNCESDCEVKSGVYVYPNEIVRMNCGQGYAPNDTLSADATFVCTSSTWFPQIPECLKLCSALKKENLRFECTYKKQEVDCDGYMRAGTIAKYRCVSHYTFADPLAFTGSTICQIGGRWKDHLPTCIPQCGVENQVHTGQTTISFGAKTVYGKYPWHIGLFSNTSIFNPCNQNNPDNCRNNFINMCGGTLIHKNFVLSAAHCLFHPSTGERFREIDFRVAGGKYKRNFNIRETYQQISGVRLFIIPETYAGTHTRYEHDIALIYTEVSFVFNDFVLPACLDTSVLFIPTHSALGTIVGWGLTEDQTYSEDLKEVHLPVMPTVACRHKYRNFIQFITSDKFCVIYRDGAGAQEGDSGGGITFIYGGRHYVVGIVSVKKRDSNIISAFTNVSIHMDWLQTSIKSIISQQRQN